jgi:hypothetical protein
VPTPALALLLLTELPPDLLLLTQPPPTLQLAILLAGSEERGRERGRGRVRGEV